MMINNGHHDKAQINFCCCAIARMGGFQPQAALFNRDPFSCVLCGARMVSTGAVSGLTVQGLVNNAKCIAQLRYLAA